MYQGALSGDRVLRHKAKACEPAAAVNVGYWPSHPSSPHLSRQTTRTTLKEQERYKNGSLLGYRGMQYGAKIRFVISAGRFDDRRSTNT